MVIGYYILERMKVLEGEKMKRNEMLENLKSDMLNNLSDYDLKNIYNIIWSMNTTKLLLKIEEDKNKEVL